MPFSQRRHRARLHETSLAVFGCSKILLLHPVYHIYPPLSISFCRRAGKMQMFSCNTAADMLQ
jgi:hypothetical protein